MTGGAKAALSARIRAAYDDPAERATHTEQYAYYPTEWKSPYIDMRALLGAGQVEVREYRAMFVDNSVPNGDWCDVAKITVSP